MAVPLKPPSIDLPFAEDGDKATIPTEALFGRAALTTGFPVETQTPLAAGGVAPNRLDVNGIFNTIYHYLYWIQSGGLTLWTNTLDYPFPAIVVASDNNLYLSKQPSGPTIPGVGPKNPVELGSSDYWLNPLANIGLLDYALIGSIVPIATTSLSPHFLWADGSLALFSHYPQLRQKYENNELTGMVLPHTATPADKNNFPGKFVVNSDSTGLYLPRINNYFMRAWMPGNSKSSGQGATDTGRNVIGSTDAFMNYTLASGAFAIGNYAQGIQTVTTAQFGYHTLSMDAQRVWGASHTGSEFAPMHVMIPMAVYLGIYL